VPNIARIDREDVAISSQGLASVSCTPKLFGLPCQDRRETKKDLFLWHPARYSGTVRRLRHSVGLNAWPRRYGFDPEPRPTPLDEKVWSFMTDAPRI